MFFTDSGIVMLLRLVQPQKAPSSILVTELDNVNLLNPVQERNADFPMSFTESGIVTVVMLVHPEKAESPINLTESENVILFRAVQPLNAESPIAVTEFGITELEHPTINVFVSVSTIALQLPRLS